MEERDNRFVIIKRKKDDEMKLVGHLGDKAVYES